MAGLRLVIESLCDPGPVILVAPVYPPFRELVELTGRTPITVGARADGRCPTVDVELVEHSLATGARTVLLSSPCNPTGKIVQANEWAALFVAVSRCGARLLVDSVNAPLVLPGNDWEPPLAQGALPPGMVQIVSSSKAWHTEGLRCAQVVTSDGSDASLLRSLPWVADGLLE